MDRQEEEPGSDEHRLLSSKAECASIDEAAPAVKETPLPLGMDGFSQASRIPLLNDGIGIPTMDGTGGSAMKGSGSSLDCPTLPHSQSPSGSPASNHLVYVRRKQETEAGKASNLDCGRWTPDHQLSSPEDGKLVNQSKETTSPILSKLALVANSSGKPSTSDHGKKSNFESASPETNDGRGAAAVSIKRTKVSHWEERFHQLQQLLQTLDQSDRKDYLQMLRSLSSSELSRHAVQLEERSIQLSLEEAKEMQRVIMLNVLGKSD